MQFVSYTTNYQLWIKRIAFLGDMMITNDDNSLSRWLKNGIAALAISFAPTIFANVNPESDNGLSNVPTNQIIIKYKVQSKAYGQAQKVDQMLRVNQAVGLQMKYVRPMSGNAHVLQLPQNTSTEQAQIISNELMTLPEVEYAQPDIRMYPMVVPNDPLYAQEWSLSDTYGIKMPTAWVTSKGYATVVVAVIDTGYTNHADLAGKFLPGYDFITNTFIANDGNGRDNDAHDTGDAVVANACFSGSPAENSSWHGTHVSGTIGALSNNGLGMSGINWKSKILPVRVLGRCGGSFSDIIDGMRWAAGLPVPGVPNNPHPAKVLSLSLGGQAACTDLPAAQQAIDEIYNNGKGAIIVVAAGNDNADAAGYIPASCNHIITVAATGRDGKRAYYSNFGSVVDIAAPGGAQSFENDPLGILSTLNTGTTGPVGDTYVNYQGTSMATPHISGIVSLLISRNPNLTFAQVLQLLQQHATAFAPGSDCPTKKCGTGIANAAGSLAGVPPATRITTSIAADDGLVLESSETSNAGGTINATANNFYLGDNSTRKQYRAILSFNTAGLPDDAVIIDAKLKLRPVSPGGLVGTNPFTAMGPLLADIKQPYFGTSAQLQAADFQSPANALGAATFASSPISGYYLANVKSNALMYINKKGITQFRLRFTKDDNNNSVGDYMKFYSSEISTANYRPQLIIQYFRP